MGITGSTVEDFQKKYSHLSTGYFVKKGIVQIKDKPVLFNIDHRFFSQDRFTKLKRAVLSCEENKHSYIKKIEDIYDQEKQEDRVEMMLVSQVDGADLFTLLKNRQLSGFNHNEEDACFMVECLCRGITQAEEIGLQIPFINSFSVYLTKQYTFKLLMIPKDVGYKSINTQQSKSSEMLKQIDTQTQTTNKILNILQKQSHTDNLAINLFFIGLLCLRMMAKKLKVNSLYSIQHEQINYHLISQAINQIKDKRLKWLLWLLLNQYPCQRKEVFNQLNPLFVKVNYPKDILLRGTSFKYDIQYILNSIISSDNQQQQGKSLIYQNNISQKVQKQFTFDKSSKNIIQSLYHPKPQANYATFNQKHSTANLMSSQSVQQFPRQQIQLPSIKLKSWLSQQTQMSSLKNNSQLGYSIKDIDSSLKKEPCGKNSFHQNESKNVDKLDVQLQTAQKQQQNNLSHYLSSEEESIILINADASDQQSEDAVKVDIDDLFGDLRTKQYAINQHSRIDHEKNQFHSPSTKSLFRKFSNSIIREESIEQSVSGQQCQVDYVLEQYESGEKFEGYKKNGQRNGYGKFYYNGGGIYEGDWKDNQMDGYGKLFYEDSMIAYQGYWKRDSFHGKGKLYNQSMNQKDKEFDYRDLTNIGNNWKIYEGQFNQDEKHGYGRLTFLNGQEFRGIFKNDLINGEGHFIRKNGEIIQGVWNNSLLVRQYQR